MKPNRKMLLQWSPRRQGSLDLGHELIIDNFAGGGGTSTGLEAAFGRPVDIAINHDPQAIAMHALNHPRTKHLCENVWNVDPIEVTQNRPVALVWLSPDCKHFSKAKGGTPVSKNIRGLAWVGVRWLLKSSPRVFMLENVEEFTTWGDLMEIAPGVWIPDPSKRGDTFRAFIAMITTGIDPEDPQFIEACDHLEIDTHGPEARRLIAGLGYDVDWRELRACDNGAPTIRKRLFIVGRRDGLPVRFPEQEYGDPTSHKVIAGMLAPYRTSADCIDFSLPAQSIFSRKKALAKNTQRRVAKGLWRHVLTSAKPFIVTNTTGHPGGSIDQPLATVTTGNHHMLGQPVLAPFLNEHANASNQRTMSADEPMRTICAQVKGGHFSVVASALAPLRGTSEGHLDNARSVDQPMTTISASGTHHALVGAELVTAHIQRDMGCSVGHAADVPLGTVTAGGGGKSSLVGAHLVTIGYGERAGQDARTQDVEQPLGTVVAGGVKQAIVATHITKFRTGSIGSSMAEPMPTVTANSFIKRPGGSVPLGMVAAHLTHLTHHGERSGTSPDQPLPTVTGANRGEQALVAANLIDIGHGESCSTGAKRWGSGVRSLEAPLNAVTASSSPSALVSAFLEQANGGFYADNDGRGADEPLSTITARGTNQRLITACLVKYYSSGGQSQAADVPLHTISTKARMGVVEAMQVPFDCLAEEHREKARLCADLMREHMPEQFPSDAELVLMQYQGSLWVLVDITLRMLKPRELYRAQAFPESYIIHEIPDPDLLFKDGVQVADPLSVPRIPLSTTAQIRMCGNSVVPLQAEALIRANFAHERLMSGVAA
ncbi:DNA cytosine methyltransferase [Burkholderia cenocepacia]|uniref:DNA cytosine methyltransferase n=2 Tax=Burkholderia cenocepacia TaxID=95486 RepID=UPI001BA1B544|nr:DNA cytosine methyltransferase [Burkholderia cenocepacia]MBR8043141.1 DNA cytosine methyltransferase [Burkholderia cenocepacia]MBR8324489.1 DNA cytosine methyltransferase [Burkholderia cenocepacia]